MKNRVSKQRKSILYSTSAILLLMVGCSTDDTASPATESDYDDVAQALGSVVTTNGRGGETGILYDSVQIAVGVPSLGLVATANGEYQGKHGNLTYTYDVACDDAFGVSMATCDLTSDAANVSMSSSGRIATPRLNADVEHHAELELAAVQSGVVSVQGEGRFTLDAHFSAAWRNVEIDYELDYTVSYEDVLVRRVPLQVVGGTVRYAVHAKRVTSSDDAQSEAAFSMDAELTFASDETAQLTLDGTHHYAIDTTTGIIAKRVSK